MSLEATIDNTTEPHKYKETFLVFILLSVIYATFLRASLLFIYPMAALFLAAYLKLRFSAAFIILIFIASLSFGLSLFSNFFWKYKLLSLYHLFPFLLLLFSHPASQTRLRTNYLKVFIRCLAIVVTLSNLIGFIQIFANPESDDSFIGIYSEFSVSINGLMLLNAILFFYYLLSFRQNKNIKELIISIYFMACSILGYYGAGLVICTAAIILSFLSLKIGSIIKTVVVSIASLTLIYFLLFAIKPLTLEYNMANLKKLSGFDPHNGPRKIISFYNYGISYPNDIKDFLFGSGPGTFNSRTAFMVGSPTYFTKLPFIKDTEQPYYFKNYAYSLWNPNNNSKALYLDGFRNQPFSSILAFLGEYGFIFFLVFFALYYMYYLKVKNLYKSINTNPEARTNFIFFKFLIILLPLLLLIDNFYEYPEIMLPVLIGIKLSHLALVSLKNTIHANR